MRTYNFITLNAGSMIADNNFEVKEVEKSGNRYAYVKFRYDLSGKSSDIREVVLNEMEQQDNALFYQLQQCQTIIDHKEALRKKAKEENKIFKPQDVLREHLVYVDFNSIFKDKLVNFSLGNEYKNQTKEELEASSGNANLLRWMFDSDYGIQLSFDGKDKDDETKEWRTFLPFDKSGSMSRENQTTFIEKGLKAEVESRLLLDMRFYKNNPDDETEEEPIRVISSKYYAYRGLYMSTGYRINHKWNGFSDAELCLNHETVIVIPDEEKTLINKKLFTAETTDTNNYDENTLWTFKEIFGKVESNFFDGEGLICPAYAKHINEQLQSRYRFKKIANSFQCRLPFAKGMLHTVSVQQYLNEQLANSIFKDTLHKDEPLWIEDIFKIKRDLRKVKIILTKSCFKLVGWLTKWREYAKEGKTSLFESPEDLELVKKDPMEYYWKKAEQYKHSLYITNADSRLSDESKVRMNYQFLSTLAMPPKDFETLIQKQIDYIKELPQRLLELNGYENNIDTNEDNSINEEENPLQQQKSNLSEKCLKSLAKNKVFFSDPQVKNTIDNERKNLEKNLCLGRLVVNGEQRFLSGDLLELLRIIYQRFAWHLYKERYGTHLGNFKFIIKKLNSTPKTNITTRSVSVNKFTKRFQLYKQLKNLKKNRLYAKRFYMPQKTLQLYPEYYYAIFRNPHLARNEQCLLRPYMKKDSLYERYFNHLTGIFMVSCESLAAMALSGADFDGDLVKVVAEECIIRAVQNSTYKETAGNKASKGKEQNQGNKKKAAKYERVLPVIVIPKLKATGEMDKGSIPFKTIKNTFSNQIGQISNTAIKFARKEYEYKLKDDGKPQETNLTDEEVKEGKCCAACTIVTGLEIDASKTGVHPKANINILQESVNFHDPFLVTKKALETIYSNNSNKYFKKPFVKEEEDGTLTGYEKQKDIDTKKKGITGLSNLPVYSPDYFVAKNKTTENEEHAEGGENQTDADANDKEPVANIDWLPGRYLKYFKDNADEKQKEVVGKTNNAEKIFFTFQKDEKWKDNLTEATKAKLYPLVEAYLKIHKLAREINKTKDFISKQKYIRYVKTMLKIQYDTMGQKIVFDGIDENGKFKPYEVAIQDALDQTYATIYTAIEKNATKKYVDIKTQKIGKKEPRIDDLFRDEIKETLDRFIKSDWQYSTTEAKRREKIKNIIKPDAGSVLPAAMVKLLANFRNEGDLIFYYILKDIQNHYNADIDSEAYLRYVEKKEEERIENKENVADNPPPEVGAGEVLTENANHVNYYDELYAFYSELSTRKKVEWKKELAEKCREKMQEIMRAENEGSDEASIMDLALQYIFSIPNRDATAKNAAKTVVDARRRFLWDIFTLEEIERNVYVPQE